MFYAIARSIPEGTWEFVCHPGYNDQDLQAGKTRLRESRENELHVLTLPAARDVLAQQGIELISYRELAESGHPRIGPAALRLGSSEKPWSDRLKRSVTLVTCQNILK